MLLWVLWIANALLLLLIFRLLVSLGRAADQLHRLTRVCNAQTELTDCLSDLLITFGPYGLPQSLRQRIDKGAVEVQRALEQVS